MFADLLCMHSAVLLFSCNYNLLSPSSPGFISHSIFHDVESVLTMFDLMTHTPLDNFDCIAALTLAL
jgi:hypothetical protein